jgi:hypothetical protein
MTDLLDDRMDRRLSVAGRRWQAEQPPPPVVPLELLEEPLPRRVTWRALAAAAAAVLVVGGGVAGAVRATGSHSGASSSEPTSSPVTHGVPVSQEVVPWSGLPATHPKVGHKVDGRWVTPYDDIWATGHIAGHVHPGDTVVFVAVLHSSTNVVLNPCPDFSIGFGRSSTYVGRLNCSQVLTWTARHTTTYSSSLLPPKRFRRMNMRGFHPTLLAGKTLRFQMQVTVPDVHGAQKVIWTLDGPSSSPGFYGIVHVTAG